MTRVTSKHSSSRRGFFLVSLLVRPVGKPVERVEPHDLWIRTALHRSTHRRRRRRPSTISHCYQTRATPNYFHPLDDPANDTTGCPVQIPRVARHSANNFEIRTVDMKIHKFSYLIAQRTIIYHDKIFIRKKCYLSSWCEGTICRGNRIISINAEFITLICNG